jgi:prolyl-tRNA editing enzyme YbaK/EbsC (Cys-tRNA(Pro) deacylase)
MTGTGDAAAMTTAPAGTPEQARAAILAHPAVTHVREALAGVGVTTEVVVLDGAARTAAQAAAYLGVLTAQIANSLVFVATTPDADPHQPPEPLLMLASGVHRVDTAKVADLLELGALDMADAEMVRATTGFVIGGVAPVGHIAPVRTLIDVSLARYDTVWAAAGHPHAVFATTYDELLRITGGQPIEAT